MSAPGAGGGGGLEELAAGGLKNLTGGSLAAAIFVILVRVLPNYFNGTSADAKAMRDEYRAEFARYSAELVKVRSDMTQQKADYEKEIEELRVEHKTELDKLRTDYETKITELTGKLDSHNSRYLKLYGERAAVRARVNALELQLSIDITGWPPDDA